MLDLELSPAEWCISREEYVREEDGLYESLFSLTNGRVGIRATVDFDAGGGNPGCFFSGLYGRGIAVRSELVNALHFGYWAAAVGGIPLHMGNSRLLQFRQVLDLRRAALWTSLLYLDANERTTELAVYMFLPAAETDLMVTVFDVCAVDHDSQIELHSGIDWQSGNGYMGGSDGALQLHHLHEHEISMGAGRISVCAKNRGTDRYVAAVTSHDLHEGSRVSLRLNTRAFEVLQIPAKPARHYRVLRLTVFGTGNNPGDLVSRCDERVRWAAARDPDFFLENHRAIWESRWTAAEIRLKGPPEDVEGIRFGLFHLLQAPDREAHATNIPARGLTSEYHSGHFFFNSELFMVPYYATTEPATARSMIIHRVNTLEAARRHAQDTGYEGARYPEEADWEGCSAGPRVIRDLFTGEEAEEWSCIEVMHLSADVLYALTRYLDATGDVDFLSGATLQMVVEIARYCASLMRYDPEVGGRGARSVMCFDEFHYHVSHHWSTNFLAAWALRKAAALLDIAQTRQDVSAARAKPSIGVDAMTRESWKQAASEVFLPPADESGIYPQFLGYFSLPEQLAQHGRNHRLPSLGTDDEIRMSALLPFETRLIKQADVVLVMSMFPEAFDARTVEANFAFYEPRTVHGSSLSAPPHACVAARLGKLELARHYLLVALRYNLDFQPRVKYTNGVHLAGFAGAFNALLEGFLGFRGSADEIFLEPRLPVEWSLLSVPLKWHGHQLEIKAEPKKITIIRESGPGRSLTVRVGALTKTMVTYPESLEFLL